MTWVAYTPKEGRWEFTAAASPEQAITNFLAAVMERRVLSHPIENPITAVKRDEFSRAKARYETKRKRRTPT